MKDKLKNEYVEMLNKIGLKWSVHERRPISADLVPSSTLSTHSSGQETPNLPALPESKPPIESKPEIILDSKPESMLDSKPESKPDIKPEDAPEIKLDEKDVPEIPRVPDTPQSGGASEPQPIEDNMKLEDTADL